MAAQLAAGLGLIPTALTEVRRLKISELAIPYCAFTHLFNVSIVFRFTPTTLLQFQNFLETGMDPENGAAGVKI